MPIFLAEPLRRSAARFARGSTTAISLQQQVVHWQYHAALQGFAPPNTKLCLQSTDFIIRCILSPPNA